MVAKTKIKELIKTWQDEYNEIKTTLFINNVDNMVEYNRLCTQALQLHECINDATRMLVDWDI